MFPRARIRVKSVFLMGTTLQAQAYPSESAPQVSSPSMFKKISNMFKWKKTNPSFVSHKHDNMEDSIANHQDAKINQNEAYPYTVNLIENRKALRERLESLFKRWPQINARQQSLKNSPAAIESILKNIEHRGSKIDARRMKV